MCSVHKVHTVKAQWAAHVYNFISLDSSSQSYFICYTTLSISMQFSISSLHEVNFAHISLPYHSTFRKQFFENIPL